MGACMARARVAWDGWPGTDCVGGAAVALAGGARRRLGRGSEGGRVGRAGRLTHGPSEVVRRGAPCASDGAKERCHACVRCR